MIPTTMPGGAQGPPPPSSGGGGGSSSVLMNNSNNSSSSSRRRMTGTTRRIRAAAPHEDENRKRTAQLFLAVACLWPLLVYLVFPGSSPASGGSSSSSGGGGGGGGVVGHENNSHHASPGMVLRNQMKALLNRVDLMGYGPSHPRVAVVIVGDGETDAAGDGVAGAVESVFSNTDRNRLLVVCTIMDGMSEDSHLVSRLEDIDAGGSVQHWHGLKSHMHLSNHNDADPAEGEERHGQKVHVIFNPQKRGVAASRAEGADFVKILAKKHEDAGLKSPDEDIILLLLRSDARLVSNEWLSHVTSALIIPPDPFHVQDDLALTDAGQQTTSRKAEQNSPTRGARKLANAISFGVDHDPSFPHSPGVTTTFDFALRPKPGHASTKDMALSNGESYPTPALSGAATAMRLETFLHMPARDLALTGYWSTDLELSLNLWLCGDGIDVIAPLSVALDPNYFLPFKDTKTVTVEDAIRIATAWMDKLSADAVYRTVVTNIGGGQEVSISDVTRLASEIMHSPTFPANLQKKCRPFTWYAQNINMDMQLSESGHDAMDSAPAEEKKKSDEKKVPSKPLDKARLEIVEKAPSVDIAYVDVSGGHKDHPHMGARDENGNWGYVHDETALRRNPPPFTLENKEIACDRRDSNYKMLTEKVFVDIPAHEAAERKENHKRAKIFCVVYTIEKYHDKLSAIRETWGQKCDGFMVASTKTDKSLGTVEIPHEGEEEYKNIWQKVRSIWSYVYDNYYEKYDWFHIGGDDLYLIVENLRLYLESEEIQLASNGGKYLPNGDETAQTPLFLGRRFAEGGNMDRVFNSGGSGYTLNKAALKTLVVDQLPRFFPHMKTFAEDVQVAGALRKMGIVPYDTKDEEGGERYMPFQPGHHLTYKPPADFKADWYSKFSIDVKWGIDHCAARSVAFHYIKPPLMKRMHAILYHYC